MQSVPLVGRDDVARAVDVALARAAAGDGSIMLVSGEAGIGKTRLCEQIRHAQGDPGKAGPRGGREDPGWTRMVRL